VKKKAQPKRRPIVLETGDGEVAKVFPGRAEAFRKRQRRPRDKERRARQSDVDNLVKYLNAAITKVEEQEARFYVHEAEMRERVGRMEREYSHAAYASGLNELKVTPIAIAPSFWQRVKMALRRWRQA
jgi:hypothetical protein